jgi:hypothetical protein
LEISLRSYSRQEKKTWAINRASCHDDLLLCDDYAKLSIGHSAQGIIQRKLTLFTLLKLDPNCTASYHKDFDNAAVGEYLQVIKTLPLDKGRGTGCAATLP